jgi:hypothetical protein
MHRLMFRAWLDEDPLRTARALLRLAQAPTITKCITFPSHNAANLAVVLESFIKDWTALLSTTVSKEVASAVAARIVVAEALLQPKLRSEEGQTPSFLELAERLSGVVSGRVCG